MTGKESYKSLREYEQEGIRERVRVGFERWKIKKLLFDVDGTLLNTGPLVRGLKDQALSYLLQFVRPERAQILRRDFGLLSTNANGEFGADPRKWEVILGRLGTEYPEIVVGLDRSLGFLNDIYKLTPDLKEGVREALEVCQEAGMEMVGVTMGSLEWTVQKLDRSKLDKFIPADRIVTSFGRPKRGVDWIEGCRILGVLPKEAMVAGDDAVSDMWAAKIAGINWRAYVLNSGMDKYYDDVPPAGTMLVSGLWNLVEVVAGFERPNFSHLRRGMKIKIAGKL